MTIRAVFITFIIYFFILIHVKWQIDNLKEKLSYLEVRVNYLYNDKVDDY